MAQKHRLVTRQCPVCDWTADQVGDDDKDVSCPVCYAPTRIARERWLVDAAAARTAAAAFGRQGGLKGGKIRARRLSAARRREIARKAAAARWRR
jgi:hypothetical protein